MPSSREERNLVLKEDYFPLRMASSLTNRSLATLSVLKDLNSICTVMKMALQ